MYQVTPLLLSTLKKFLCSVALLSPHIIEAIVFSERNEVSRQVHVVRVRACEIPLQHPTLLFALGYVGTCHPFERQFCGKIPPIRLKSSPGTFLLQALYPLHEFKNVSGSRAIRRPGYMH